jgi:formate dehydrogenase major subunit
VPGLGTSFGRGGATTALQDLANADAILIMGSSMAENHPVGFQWVVEARERGAKIIHVDPRFTRTSAMADIWVPLRAGTDILFLGGLIRYALENDTYFREYVQHYTNAPMIIRDGYRDTEDLGGVFSGWDEQKKKYSPETWIYKGAKDKDAGSQTGHEEAGGGYGKQRGGEAAQISDYESDPTLQDPNCVFQILRRHFARYTPELIEKHAGVPEKLFLKVAETFCSASGPDKTAAICYAVGWTQHSKGVQIIRAAAILQLLQGNIGRPGGGILALRGHASIQGSTDIPTLYDILPGYLPMPFFEEDAHTLKDFLKKHTATAGIWSNFDSYFISLMKSWYGDNARQENDWCFDLLPRVTGDHSHFGYWLDMQDGKMDGLFIMGQNPAVGAPNARLQRTAMSKLKWLVVRDLVEVESASWWYNSPEVIRGELKPEEIGTEIFLFPAAGSAEKDGCQTQTQRMVQFRTKAVDPPGDARSETWFIHHLARRLKAKAAADPSPRNAALNSLYWPYGVHGRHDEPNVNEVLKEINGRDLTTGKLLADYKKLKNDASTACGCWIYCGIYPDEHLNKANQREPQNYLGHGWGFAWPNDVRILYNRCSARPDGKPWSERKKLVWWDEDKREWTGIDKPDFQTDKPPDYRAPKGAKGMDAIGGDKPFILHPDGVGWLFVTSGLKDGPLPSHYEPLETQFGNPLYPEHVFNPAADRKERPDNAYAKFADERFPYVLTTYRLTEHHTAGGMSRYLSHLSELQPELFCEVSPELASDARLQHGEFATIMTPRGIVEARVLVTKRMRPLWVEGRTVHQVGLPYHWGFNGLVTGDVANDLLVISEEPNVRIMETKALICDIEPGRRARGAEALEQHEAKLEQPA